MSRSLDDLIPSFLSPVQDALSRCESEGHELRVFYTRRDVWEQARLWRQSRTGGEIRSAIRKLEQSGAGWLAEVVHDVGPQYGRWATNALPGLSWHQHGEAVDAFVSVRGRAVWASGHPGYRAWAEAAKAAGLVSGYFWDKRDAVHVQARRDRVRNLYSWQELDQLMQAEFGPQAPAYPAG
tara:strand:- start:468 stop:1010 length:543 start_codon:yes stop_codon:yes gene_type:complete